MGTHHTKQCSPLASLLVRHRSCAPAPPPLLAWPPHPWPPPLGPACLPQHVMPPLHTAFPVPTGSEHSSQSNPTACSVRWSVTSSPALRSVGTSWSHLRWSPPAKASQRLTTLTCRASRSSLL